MKSDDPTVALREKLLALTYSCPKGRYASRCPFAMLSGLSHDSRKTVLDGMSHDRLLDLFKLVPTCACPADPSCPEQRTNPREIP